MKRWAVLIGMCLALVPMAVLAQDTGAGEVETKSPIELWNAYAGIAASLLTGVIIRKGWSKGMQAGAAVVASIVAALIGQWLTDGFRGEGWADPTLAIVKVVTLSQIAYQTLFAAIPLPQWIESKTGGDDLDVTNPHRTHDVQAPDGEVKRVVA